IWDLDRVTDWQRARWFACAAAVSGLAGLLNPYGWNLHLHVFHYLTDSQLLSRIGEFQSFDFHAAGAGQIIASLVIGLLGGALALGQRRLQHFILALLLSAAALRSARALPLVALVLLPLANASLTEGLRSAGFLRRGVRLALDRFLAYSA